MVYRMVRRQNSENVENIYVPLVLSYLENGKMEIANQTVSPPRSIDTWTS
jgi:hypothetical protein